MGILNSKMGLYTDHYELTMAQAYFLTGRHLNQAVFDYFFRKLPFNGGYVIFAGLNELLPAIEQFRFDKEDILFLESIGFDKKFTKYLSDFSFEGNIYAPGEGEVVFPKEPLIRVEGNIIETQLIETMLLNLINFESLIATKAARIRFAAGDSIVIDFGLRRAQGFGGIQASRAAMIGGMNATSNLYSARLFGVPSSGTQAHSWIQTYDSELEAFRDFATRYPDNCIILVDTYDTLRSGVPNAIKVAREMEQTGHKLKGIRLDSGDLAYLSKKARKMLDDAGLHYVSIVASNQLDEHLIKSLNQQGAAIDSYGIGTRLVTGMTDAALDGVYKLSGYNGQPKLKMSDNIEKLTLPDKKKIIRYFDNDGYFYADAITLLNEDNPERMIHPDNPDIVNSKIHSFRKEEILQPVMKKGQIVALEKDIKKIAKFSANRLKLLPGEHKRFENPHVYKVGLSDKLFTLRKKIVASHKSHILGG